jgi:hypothetical protein
MRRLVTHLPFVGAFTLRWAYWREDEQALLVSSEGKMTANQEAVERTFVFKFPTCTTKKEIRLEVPIYIPYSGSIKELTQRLISSFKLPCYVEKGWLYHNSINSLAVHAYALK